MSAVMGIYVQDGDMSSGSELCLECANAFRWRSTSRGRRDVTMLWIHGTLTCAMQGGARCWTLEAVRDPDILVRQEPGPGGPP